MGLADDIREFLDDHAKVRPDYDPEFEEPAERFTSPDASELLAAARIIEKGNELPSMPWSSWGSGGYAPYDDKEAKARHDELLDRIRSRFF